MPSTNWKRLEFDYNEKPAGYYDQIPSAAPRFVLGPTEVLYRTPFSSLGEKGGMYAHVFVVRDEGVTVLRTLNRGGKDIFLTSDELLEQAKTHCSDSLKANTAHVEKDGHRFITNLTDHWQNAALRAMK